MKPRAVGRAVSDYVLRRTKEQVLTDLPPKLFRDADLELTPEQAAAYQLAEDEGVIKLREMKHAVTIQHVFELVLRLKQICNFDPATGESSKFERLEADLEECAASGRKAIVFSQWVETLLELKSRLARFSPEEFHGQIPAAPPRRRHRTLPQRQSLQRDADELRRRQRRPQPAIRQLRVPLRPLVEPGRRRPGHQPRPPHRRHRPGHRSRGSSRVGTIEQRINQILEEKRELFDSVFSASNSAAQAGPLPRRNLLALQPAPTGTRRHPASRRLTCRR